MKLSGVSLTRDCADQLKRYAKDSALTVNAAITNVIEEWAVESLRFWDAPATK